VHYDQGAWNRGQSTKVHRRARPHERDIDPSCAEGSPLSALVCIDGAASFAERALDLLAPAALSTVAAKTTEHMIEDIVAISGFMTFWACQFPIAVAVRACGLRRDGSLSRASRYGYGNGRAARLIAPPTLQGSTETPAHRRSRRRRSASKSVFGSAHVVGLPTIRPIPRGARRPQRLRLGLRETGRVTALPTPVADLLGAVPRIRENNVSAAVASRPVWPSQPPPILATPVRPAKTA
jgi:hypothetical protein